MHSKKFIQLSLAFLLSTFFCYTAAGDQGEVKKIFKTISEQITGKSLVRKDLLFEKRRNLYPPRRNIFAPRKRPKPMDEFLPEGTEGNLNESAANFGENEFVIMPDIRYIGYVDSGRRIIALIFFGEEVLAVEKGEMIDEEIKVGRISTAEIVVIGPDSREWKFSLEGEGE